MPYYHSTHRLCTVRTWILLVLLLLLVAHWQQSTTRCNARCPVDCALYAPVVPNRPARSAVSRKLVRTGTGGSADETLSLLLLQSCYFNSLSLSLSRDSYSSKGVVLSGGALKEKHGAVTSSSLSGSWHTSPVRYVTTHIALPLPLEHTSQYAVCWLTLNQWKRHWYCRKMWKKRIPPLDSTRLDDRLIEWVSEWEKEEQCGFISKGSRALDEEEEEETRVGPCVRVCLSVCPISEAKTDCSSSSSSSKCFFAPCSLTSDRTTRWSTRMVSMVSSPSSSSASSFFLLRCASSLIEEREEDGGSK